MTKKIVIAEDEPITRMDICEMVKSAGYDLVGEAADGLCAVDICRRLKPDLVLMDIKMPKLDGIQAAKVIIDNELVGAVVMLTAYSGKEFVNKVKEIGAMGYIVKPIDEKSLIPQIEIAIHKSIEIKDMREKIKRENTIHRAKEMLMEKYKVGENEAYKKIRKTSMDNQCTLIKTALNIIEKFDK